MLLSAKSAKSGTIRDDALAVLNRLAYAKAELDSAMFHTHPTIDVTGDILFTAQEFTDDATVPCTEWPTSDEVLDIVLVSAKKYSGAKEWKKAIKNESGAIIGVKPF